MTKKQVEEVIRRYYDDNANVLPAKSYCDLVFPNNTYEEFDNLIEKCVVHNPINFSWWVKNHDKKRR